MGHYSLALCFHFVLLLWMKKPEGAWIFVSHSNKDIEEVREIRNHLERRGHNPLLFFLKCIEDAEELRVLLKREIEARQIFLLS